MLPAVNMQLARSAARRPEWGSFDCAIAVDACQSFVKPSPVLLKALPLFALLPSFSPPELLRYLPSLPSRLKITVQYVVAGNHGAILSGPTLASTTSVQAVTARQRLRLLVHASRLCSKRGGIGPQATTPSKNNF